MTGYPWTPTINALTSADVSTRTICDVATVQNVNLATDLAAGQVVDSRTLVAGDLVLVRDQSAPEENGVYVVGSGAAARADGWDTAADFGPDRVVPVIGGDYWSDSAHRFDGIVAALGTDPIYVDEWIPTGSDLFHFVEEWDRFVLGGNMAWDIAGGGTFSRVGNDQTIGVLQMTPAAGNRCECIGGDMLVLTNLQRRSRLEFLGYQDAAFTGADTGVTNIGLLDRTFTNPPDEGVYFTQRDTLATTNWFCGIASGAARTEQDSAVSAVAAANQRLTIDITPAQEAIFYIDRVRVAALSGSNFPVNPVPRLFECGQTGGTGTINLQSDRYELRLWRAR